MDGYEEQGDNSGPKCHHGHPAVLKISGPQAKNPGKAFLACPVGAKDKGGCGFFQWNAGMQSAPQTRPEMFPSSFSANKKRQWEEPPQFAQGSPQRQSFASTPSFAPPQPQTLGTDFSLTVLESRLRQLEASLNPEESKQTMEELVSIVAEMQADLKSLIVLFREMSRLMSTTKTV